MKLTKSFVYRMLILAVAGIILSAVIPYFSFQLLEKHVVDEAIIGFNKNAAVSDSIFTSEFNDHPKTIEGFDFAKLEDLGKQLEIDLSDIIQKSKEPYGSFWLLAALSNIIITLVYQLATTILSAYAKNRIIASILSLLGFLFVLILGKSLLKKLNLTRDDDSSPLVLNKLQVGYRTLFLVLELAIISYTIFYFVKNAITFFKYPPIYYLASINFNPSFYMEGIVIITGVVILISIFITIVKKNNNQSNKYLTLFWTIPVLAIGVCLYLANFQISMLNNMIDVQNLNTNRQNTVLDCFVTTISAKQWYLQNEDQYNLEDFLLQVIVDIQKLEHGTYQVSAEDTILTITGTGNFVDKKGNRAEVISTYNSAADSISTEILK